VYRKIKGAWRWIIGTMASRSLLRRIGIQPAYRISGDHYGPRLLRFSDSEALHRLIPLTGDRSVCGNTYGSPSKTDSTRSMVCCSIPKIQILKFSQTCSKFKMNFKFRFKMFVCELISTNKNVVVYILSKILLKISYKYFLSDHSQILSRNIVQIFPQ
jgi:hypothetical protein